MATAVGPFRCARPAVTVPRRVPPRAAPGAVVDGGAS